MQLHKEIIEILNSGEEILEPETLRKVHPELTEDEFNQIMALKILRSTRGFWEDMHIFEDCVQSINGLTPNPRILQGCTPEQIWFGLEVAKSIHPTYEYSHEVLKYIEFMFKENGVYIFPPYLPISNIYFARAVDLAANGPFPLSDNSPEEIQAAKYLAIQEYIKLKGE